MKLNDIIRLSLYYAKKSGYYSMFSPGEVISIGYQAYLICKNKNTDNTKYAASTIFLNNLKWLLKEEQIVKNQIKVSRKTWDTGKRPSYVEYSKKKYEKNQFHESSYYSEVDIEKLHKACKGLSKRKRTLLYYRYGFENFEKHSFTEIAKKFNISPQRVRVIHNNTIKELQKIIGQ